MGRTRRGRDGHTSLTSVALSFPKRSVTPISIRCTVCGSTHEVRKWEGEYEQARDAHLETYICDTCQARIQQEAQRNTFPH
ncbi:MAG: DUF2197 domain-containing protein [Clostridia bacterium]